jgi:ComF family protein
LQIVQNIKEALLHLAFPQVCAGCGNDVLPKDHLLCLSCLEALPQTQFHLHANNPIEKTFIGRLPLQHATAQYYFTKESLLQHLLHRAKYKGDRELCVYLGTLMGRQLAQTDWIHTIDALVPLPLFAEREKKRGYNQSYLLCQGMFEVLQKPVLKNIVIRQSATESQTRKNRVQRWQNMEGRFLLKTSEAKGKHLLLVDDVVTTGATLEACGRALLTAPGSTLSVATLCFSVS